MSFDSEDSILIPAGPKEVIVEDYSDSDDSSVPEFSSDEEDRRELPHTGTPPEYWHIQKLIKYLKTGNQTATVVALCCLKDHDLSSQTNQLAIQDIGGLEVLVNLLETKDIKCKLGALSVLCTLSQSVEIRRYITNLGGIDLLVRNLTDPARDLQILIGETIYNIAQIRKARKHIRKCNGIPKLVDLLDIDEELLITSWEELNSDEREQVNVTTSAAKALWSTSRCLKNVKEMMKYGSVPLLAKLVRSVHIEVIVPIIGIISLCAADPSYQLAIETEGIMKDVVKHLSADAYPSLRCTCAETIFRCSESAVTRDQVREAGGLDPLVSMARDPRTTDNLTLLAAVTGAIWKTAITTQNVERYDQLRTVNVLVVLLENVTGSGLVLTNVVGALSELLKFEHNADALRRCGGIPLIVNLLNYTYKPLLENAAKVLRECAKEQESMRAIEELDGVRLLWSLLKVDSPKVQSSAARALVPCVKNALDSAEMVRCFVGGLELICTLLKSNDNQVLASMCAAISQIAQDTENLGILTDHGVIPLLVKLLSTEDEDLRENLGSAIAYCSGWGANCKVFGRLGAITPLVRYMTSGNPRVHRTAALALFHLSENPFNCITMHESGVVPYLLKATASKDHELQEAAAGCLGNIRRLALEAETYHLITRGRKKEESVTSEED